MKHTPNRNKLTFYARVLALGLCPIIASSIVAAKDKAPVSISSTGEVLRETKDASGKVTVKKLPLKTAAPGEEVMFTNTITNQSSVSVNNNAKNEPDHLSVTNAISPNLKLLKVWGANAVSDCSIDGGKQFSTVTKLTVKQSNGVPRPASLEDCTHIRWTLTTTLKPNQATTVGFNALVK